MKHWADGDSSPWRPSLTHEEAQLLEQAYTEAIQFGFLGPRERERLWERHLNDALGLAGIRTPAPGERWADLGSGAGLPGLPLAVAHRATSFTMIDAQRRRLDWVEAAAQTLRLTNVTVAHARLEDYARGPARASFDVATARALGPLPSSPNSDFPCSRSVASSSFREGNPILRSSSRQRSPASSLVVGSTRLSPTRARRLTRSVSSLSWQRSLRPPPLPPAIGRASAHSARSAAQEQALAERSVDRSGVRVVL